MNRRVSDLLRLADDCQPLRRLQRIERVNRAAPAKMPALLLLNLGDKLCLRAGLRFDLCFEVRRKKRETFLVDNLAASAVCECDRGQTPADSFEQHGTADVADGFHVAR